MADENKDFAVQIIPDGETMPGEDHVPKRVDMAFHTLENAAPVHDKPMHANAWNEIEEASRQRHAFKMKQHRKTRKK